MARNTISTRFHRVAAAFDADMKRVRPCDSIEYSSSTDLSDLVKSFMEKNDYREGEGEDVENLDWFDDSDNDKLETLKEIFAGGECDDDNDACREEIRREAELAWSLVGEDTSLPGFKRLFMSRLRERGFDAGLCKSKWEKNRKFPGSEYEYIDVNFAGSRYIVEISLVAQFEIARPTNQYSALLDVFPHFFSLFSN
ncbi:uncharacterized protein LOC130719840 [Lotus japonicus]|uniref:uncharacterized protein LOC130719840 n=1 Tax=Lotus japonicus TaxID=34305 RepID=UPI0025883928|nr:uncharacterized protein LOC130719840 [Lotus japonicus]